MSVSQAYSVVWGCSCWTVPFQLPIVDCLLIKVPRLIFSIASITSLAAWKAVFIAVTWIPFIMIIITTIIINITMILILMIIITAITDLARASTSCNVEERARAIRISCLQLAQIVICTRYFSKL